MNKKRIARIFSLALCFIFALSVQSFALSSSSMYHASKWQADGNTTIYGSYGGAYNDITYVYRSWSEAITKKFNENCFYFARLVTHKTKHVDFNYQTDSFRAIYLYGGHVKGVDELSGRSVSDIARLLCQYLYAPSVSQIETAFSNVKPGDVIQFRGWKIQRQHTMVVAEVYSNGFETLEGNNPEGTVRNGSYTFSEFRNIIAAAGYYGGFSIYRFGLETVRPPEITKLPSGESAVAGYYFNYQSRAEGQVDSWSTSSGTIPSDWASVSFSGLPSGISINRSTGAISGTPAHTQQGKTSYMPLRYYFNVNASNSGGTSTKSSLITVYEPPVITTNTNLPSGSVGSYYNQELYAEGTEWSMTWEIKYGKLPAGLKFNPSRNSRRATITGTPTQPGTYMFEIECWNLVGNPETRTTKTFKIVINGEYRESNIWINYTLKDGKVGEDYSDWLSIGYSSLMYYSRIVAYGAHVDAVSGSLPPGLKLSHSGMYIYLKGTPTRAGSYTFTVRMTDSLGGYTEKTLTVVISDNSSRIARPDSSMSIRYYFLNGKYGVYYRDYIIVNGGTAPYRVERISGNLPGLSLRVAGNYIYLYGLPTTYGTFTFTLRITGEHNGYIDKTFTFNIAANSAYQRGGAGDDDEPSAPKILTSKLPDASAGSEWSAVLEASGTQPITWRYEGEGLPEGFIVNEDGTISGLPLDVGNYKFKVTAENSEGTNTKKFTLKVKPAKPTITTMSLPDGVKGMPYNYVPEASGTEPIKFSKSGKFPKGLKLNKTTGEISGTPTKEGTYNFKIKAKNKGGKDTAEFQIVINPEFVSKDNVIQNASFKAVSVRSIPQDEALNDLYVITDDEEIFDEFEAEAGSALTLGFDEWTDEFGDEVEVSKLTIFINNEPVEGLEISSNGTFTLPAELVDGELSVYVTAKAGDTELRTSEIKISTGENSSGECNFGFSGIALIVLCGSLLFKKR